MVGLPDIQQSEPKYPIALNRVGITDLKLPIFIATKDNGFQHSVAKISCYVDLEAHKKGINMSRLPIAIHKYLDQPIRSTLIRDISEHIRQVSEAELCDLTYEFNYFIKKLAPVSKEPGFINHKVIFNGVKTKDDYKFTFTVGSLGTSLCPCSKEISDGGAHNQKCLVTIKSHTDPNHPIWIEDIVCIAEKCVSCEIFSVLKRTDEKFVTEAAYANAKFVEDIARQCYVTLLNVKEILDFEVRVSSDESIHVHRAEAIIRSA